MSKSAYKQKVNAVGTNVQTIPMKFLAMLVLAATLVLPSAMANAQATPVISAIAVEGAKRVDAETVRSYLTVREGDAFDPVSIDRSLKHYSLRGCLLT